MSFLTSALESVGSALGRAAGHAVEEKAHELEKMAVERAILLAREELEELEMELWANVPLVLRCLVCCAGPRAIDKIRALSHECACLLPAEVHDAIPELFDKQDHLDEYVQKLADVMEKIALHAAVTATC
jgi:hypothetical protein